MVTDWNVLMLHRSNARTTVLQITLCRRRRWRFDCISAKRAENQYRFGAPPAFIVCHFLSACIAMRQTKSTAQFRSQHKPIKIVYLMFCVVVWIISIYKFETFFFSMTMHNCWIASQIFLQRISLISLNGSTNLREIQSTFIFLETVSNCCCRAMDSKRYRLTISCRFIYASLSAHFYIGR